MVDNPTKIRRKPTKIDLWKCEDIKALIGEKLRAEVKDVALTKRLEHLLGDEIAYGAGGGGGGGIATA